jgi:UDP-N-acetylglucosamine:LPS N-acetylglucosamine transferase
VVGGSLGAKVINQCIEANLDKYENNNIQLYGKQGVITSSEEIW